MPGILMLMYSDKLCIPKTGAYVVASLIIAVAVFLFIKYLIKFIKISLKHGGSLQIQLSYNSDKKTE